MKPEHPPPLDRRPLYPERIAVDLSRSVATALRRLAKERGTSVSALVRAAVLPIVEPAAARDAAALAAMPDGPEREQALDICAIKYGSLLVEPRSLAIVPADNVVRLKPKDSEIAAEPPTAA